MSDPRANRQANPRASRPTPGLRRFVGRVLLFLLPLALGAALLFTVPLPRAFAWYFVRGDSRGRGLWVQDRVVANPAPVDVAFVGTSTTWYGVDDAAIQRALAEAGRDLQVVNFGYGRNGRNHHYAIARDLLDSRRVKHLVVGVANDEHRGSHPLFGHLARTDDLLGAPMVTDTDYFEDLYRGLVTRLDAAKYGLLGLPWPAPAADGRLHGVLRTDRDREESAAVLDAAWARRHARMAARGAPQGVRTRRPRHYLRALADIASRHETQVHFLYLPQYGYPWAELAYRDLYEELGDLWIPPEVIFRDRRNWFDRNHLNRRGQALLAAWLAERLAALD